MPRVLIDTDNDHIEVHHTEYHDDGAVLHRNKTYRTKNAEISHADGKITAKGLVPKGAKIIVHIGDHEFEHEADAELNVQDLLASIGSLAQFEGKQADMNAGIDGTITLEFGEPLKKCELVNHEWASLPDDIKAEVAKHI